LQDNEVEYQFHDFKKEGVDPEKLNAWIDKAGWEILLNRRGTTWRKVPEAVRADINQDSAIELMLSEPSIIKRPVLEKGNALQVGFDQDNYQKLLGD
jgi:arsenate reductase